MDQGFSWYPKKAEQNVRKHGITFAEAITVFDDPKAGVVEDRSHSLDEERFLIIGQSARHRILSVIYTERKPFIRIISARLATRAERKALEEG